MEEDKSINSSENKSDVAFNSDLKSDGKCSGKRKKIHQITLENDIKYKGPLSYRHLRIIAWLAFAVAQAGTMLSVALKIDPVLGANLQTIKDILVWFSSLTLPLFLMASFSVILNAKNGYKNLILLYGSLTVLIYCIFLFVYHHYLMGIVSHFIKEGETSADAANNLFNIFVSGGLLSFNIFVDLFLCTLFTFFVNYRPQKFFTGKKIIIFRLFALIPFIYEIVSVLLKTYTSLGKISLSPYIYPLLTTKPPMMFLLFSALAFFIKSREKIFIRRGKTAEEYNAFLKTNANSFHFSIFASLAVIVVVILDVINLIIITDAFGMSGTEQAVEIVFQWGATVYAVGFGKSTVLLLTIPFILLFSYTTTYKNTTVDKFIPIVGTCLIVFLYVEGLFQFIMLFL